MRREDDPLAKRSKELVLTLLGGVVGAAGDVPQPELTSLVGDPKWSVETVRRTLRDLVDYGLVRQVGDRRRPSYRATFAGWLFMERQMPWPWEPKEYEEQGEYDDDAE